MHSPIFAPILALILWTFVMWVWLYATRLPALAKGTVVYDPLQPNDAFTAQMPAKIRWKSDNYNNLMEQPPIFYAVGIVLALIGAADRLTVALAWAYVVVRIAHSLVHALFNRVELRFGLFVLGSAILFVMSVRAALALA